jgi:hypothetical protein
MENRFDQYFRALGNITLGFERLLSHHMIDTTPVKQA